MSNKERIKQSNSKQKQMHDGCRTRHTHKKIKEQVDERRGYLKVILNRMHRTESQEM